MIAIFHDMIKKTMEVFMDDFSVFGNSFENFLSRVDKMLQRCKDTKVDVIAKLPHPTTVKGVQSFLKNGIEVDKAKVDVIAKLSHPTTDGLLRIFPKFPDR
ncbi:hypothetical protein Tco_0146881 [Tanacetum coccineum]